MSFLACLEYHSKKTTPPPKSETQNEYVRIPGQGCIHISVIPSVISDSATRPNRFTEERRREPLSHSPQVHHVTKDSQFTQPTTEKNTTCQWTQRT